MKFHLFVFCFCCVYLSDGQDTLNRFDKEGKKDGKWIVWLDKDWNKVKDSTTAIYFRYNYFDHGANLNPIGPCGGNNYKLEITPYSDQINKKVKILDGEYKWFDASGRLKFIHVLKNGEYISYKEFYPSGKLNTLFDYTKKYEGQPHSWFEYIYDKKGNIKYSDYFRKDEKGRWPASRD